MQVIETSNSGFVFKAENQAAKQSWIGAISTWSIIKIAQSSRPIKIFEWKGIKICLIIILVQLNHIHSNTLKEKLCFDLREAPSSRANRHRGFIFDLLWSWQLLFKILSIRMRSKSQRYHQPAATDRIPLPVSKEKCSIPLANRL